MFLKLLKCTVLSETQQQSVEGFVGKVSLFPTTNETCWCERKVSLQTEQSKLLRLILQIMTEAHHFEMEKGIIHRNKTCLKIGSVAKYLSNLQSVCLVSELLPRGWTDWAATLGGFCESPLDGLDQLGCNFRWLL